MEITIPLSRFVDYLNAMKQKSRTWLHETEWLVDNFRFDNESATYDPQTVSPIEIRPYTVWMLRDARN